MKKISTLLFLFAVATMPLVVAQTNCDLGRYTSNIFGVQLTSEPAIYATAPAYDGGESSPTPQDLYFDFYEPAGDTLSKRPLIIMAFGGAFLAGSKRQGELVDYCNAMASKGFCVASIDYRIGFNVLDLFDNRSAIRAVYRGAQDFKAAVRYFRANAEMYKIDPDHVFGGGNSAGSINAIHAAYIDEPDRTPVSILGATYEQGTLFNTWPDLGCLECSGNSIVGNSEPNALVNLWGAVGLLEWIEAGEAPIISFHGTADNVVDPNTAPPFGGVGPFPDLSGSIPIHDRAISLGINNVLHLFEGGGHELWADAANAAFIQEESADFLYKYMKPAPPVISGEPVVCMGNQTTYCTPQAPGSKYCWSVSGGIITADNGNCITIDWDAPGTLGIVDVLETNCLDAVGDPVSIDVVVSAAPIAAFSFLYNESAIDFMNESVDAVAYAWDFGDGNTSNEVSPSYAYAENGAYDVSLTVTNADGCEQTFTATVEQNCQLNLTLDVSVTSSGVYTVGEWIYSEQPTEDGSNVVFVAGDYIELGAGFEVPVGVEFIAVIEGCSNNNSAILTEDGNEEESEK